MKEMTFKGWIALDIDGTITLDKYAIPEEVVEYLRNKTKEGWRIAMATGRPFVFASIALSKFDFPYLFLIQNGSLVLEMPGKKELFQRYMPKSHLSLIENCLDGVAGDMLVYGGYETQDCVYYRPKRFYKEQLHYLSSYWERQKEKPVSLEFFEEIKQLRIPLVKCFGKAKEMEKVAERLKRRLEFNVALLRDPFAEDYFLLLITDREASKGQSFEAAIEQLDGRRGKIIAAGDDENDVSLLEIADIAIAMDHAPASLQRMADLIAPPTKDLGILHALRIAIGET